MVFNRKKRALDRQNVREIAIWRETNEDPQQAQEVCAFDEMIEAAPQAFAQNSSLNTCHLCLQFVSPFKIKHQHEPIKPEIKTPKEDHSVQPTLSFFLNLPGSKFTPEEETKDDQMLVKNDDKCQECLKVTCLKCKDHCSQCGRLICKACLNLEELVGSLELICESCKGE